MAETLAVQTAPTPEDTLSRMRARLKGIVPDVEIQLKADLVFEINCLKAERNAVILGHNYMEPALFHSVPDYKGDSLELSRQSAETEADLILFCGVQFMAETAKILSPHKTVLIPSQKAGCSLAAGIAAEDVRRLKEWYPGAPVVTYVNTYADVKAESDYCCTSGNAVAVVKHLLVEGYRQIIFLPDEYLARNTADELGVDFVLSPILRGEEPVIGKEPTLIGWRARCEVHEKFLPEDVRHVREQFPDVAVLAHPECSPEVVAESDRSGSTKQLIQFVRELDAPRYLLLTECSMGDNIAAENSDKQMLGLCSFRCQYMNEITVEDTLDALRNMQYEVNLPPDIIERARIPIDRMLQIR
ncbi:MAG: quinolinate synthase NadA [Candidatus Hydrogenedentes bacterium]|jgi:quinolinate synthase|nr:quinolinate synthase NadA [Candidatus Hydrogenedentota bacterium]